MSDDPPDPLKAFRTRATPLVYSVTSMLHTRAIVSSSAAIRLSHALRFAEAIEAGTDLLVVADNRAAADDFVRRVASGRPATAGLQRFSLMQLAAHLAMPRLAARALGPSSALGAEAVAARASYEAVTTGRLSYFTPVASTPGFPRALARTVGELRFSHVDADSIAELPRSGSDLAVLMRSVEEQLATAGAIDRARVFQTATESLDDGDGNQRGSLVLLDPSVNSAGERSFIEALLRAAPAALITVPVGDDTTRDALVSLGVHIVFEPATASDALSRLRSHLFSSSTPPPGQQDGSVCMFSSPGEGREALDIARFALAEARDGVRFDEMAVLTRSTTEYIGLLEHAFARAEIPAWFDRGTRRPHPAGRALLALLACADENLSARRFAEYLSLAQVPEGGGAGSEGSMGSEGSGGSMGSGGSGGSMGSTPGPTTAGPTRSDRPASARAGRTKRSDAQLELFGMLALPADEALVKSTGKSLDDAELQREAEPRRDASPDASAAVREGSLRTPWRWEDLLIESHVIAGVDRWRRLDGLAHEYELRLSELRREGEDETSVSIRAVKRDLDHLSHLRAFALPLVHEIAAWPSQARWSDWLTILESLVPRVIRQPLLVLRLLADLRPLGDIGPVVLREVRDVLTERLRTIAADAPAQPYGRIFVGTPDTVRGRAFRVVFVPGLAERMFPQKPREDPLLDDTLRERLGVDLMGQAQRIERERLRLQLAVGAATDRVYLSYPRLEIREARPRVPSFYALDVMRAITGRLPGHEELQNDTAAVTAATLAWPSPAVPEAAIDDSEHDLAILRPLLLARDSGQVKGRAHYLLTLNEHLHRSLTERWKRWRPAWTGADGIVRISDLTREPLASQRLTVRPYSLTALQRFAACPYQFMLGAIYRIEPFEKPEPLQRLDPLTKGALFHRVQAEFFRALQARQLLPLQQKAVPEALAVLDEILERVGQAEREALAPAIERVWRDEIAALRRDLRRWVELMPERDADWVPEKFEFSFGLTDDGRDPSSVRDPAVVDGRFLLRGSVDLVERHATLKALRVTDHKTGKYRAHPNLQIGGGVTLQPVLYGLAVEHVMAERVVQGRLYYCTSAGGFREHTVDLFDVARRHGIQALEIIDRAVEIGFLAAAPQTGACRYCDFRPVCGPDEERRFTRHKNATDTLLGDLLALREMP